MKRHVTAVDRGRNTLSVTLTDLSVGDRVLTIATRPLSTSDQPAVPAQTPQPFTLADEFQVDIMTNASVR